MARPWVWQNTLNVANEAARLIDGHGRIRCTVWSNGVWHTWDERGVGGENACAINVTVAKEEATMAVLRQGWASLTKRATKRLAPDAPGMQTPPESANAGQSKASGDAE
jgi:hypothetical protein